MALGVAYDPSGIHASDNAWSLNMSDGYQFGDLIPSLFGYTSKEKHWNSLQPSAIEVAKEQADYAYQKNIESQKESVKNLVEAYKKAGLNPRLAIEQGFKSDPVRYDSAFNYSMSNSQSSSQSLSNSFSSSAVLVALIALAAKVLL